MYKKNLIVLLIFVLAVLLQTGCVTSQGSLFTDVVTQEGDDKQDQDQSGEPGLTIETYPIRSDVYINNSYAGISPVTELLDTGNYRITVEKEGYYTTTEWVSYKEGDSVSIEIELEPITGTLRIEAVQEGMEITASGTAVYPGENELPVGKYSVEAELFGYEPWQGNIAVREDRTTLAIIDMTPAVFSFSTPIPGRTAFNPSNPAGLGESTLYFKVTNYGTAELEIFTEQGRSVLKHSFDMFTQSEQKYVWDGMDGYGKPLPDGNYRIVIEGRDPDGNYPTKRETWVSLDSSLVIRVRSIYSGISGTLFSPTPDILPKGSMQLALSGIGHIDPETGSYRFPVSLGIRTIPYENLEIDTQLGVFIRNTSSEAYIFSVAAKKPFFPDSSLTALKVTGTLKGTYLHNSYVDTLTNFTGLSGGITASVSTGALSLILAPELTISPFRVSYTETPPVGFYAWGYGRAALQLDIGSTVIAVSAAIRTKPFSEGFSPDYPFSAGAEIHWLIPGTGIFISGIVSGEFTDSNNYYINAGGGVGLIN